MILLLLIYLSNEVSDYFSIRIRTFNAWYAFRRAWRLIIYNEWIFYLFNAHDFDVIAAFVHVGINNTPEVLIFFTAEILHLWKFFTD